MPNRGDQPDPLCIDSAEPGGLARVHPWFDLISSHLSGPLRHGMRVALEEAVMNVAMHGYTPGTSGEITMRLTTSGDDAALIIEDAGRAFDPTAAPAAGRAGSLLDAEPGGLGLRLLRHYCENIEYERIAGRNRLTLRFRLRPG